MKINGCKVVFGKAHTESHYRGMYDGSIDIKVQRWDIPKLHLYGYATLEHDGDVMSLHDIQKEIQKEVDFDLAQREKRKHGIAA